MLVTPMEHSVVINPSGDFHPSLQSILVSSKEGDSGVVSKRSSTTYVCQFCGRVCRNAQALGGHMNVHRRERALASQLLELRNQRENVRENLEGGMSAATTTGVVLVAAAAAASSNPPAGSGERKKDHGGDPWSTDHGLWTMDLVGGMSAPTRVRRTTDHLQEEVITTHGDSSESSSSPPSPHSIAIGSSLVHPGRVLHWLPTENRKRVEAVDLELVEAVDTELRLGFTPGRFL